MIQITDLTHHQFDSIASARGIEKQALVNYHPVNGVACDYAKNRVASGGLTKPP